MTAGKEIADESSTIDRKAMLRLPKINFRQLSGQSALILLLTLAFRFSSKLHSFVQVQPPHVLRPVMTPSLLLKLLQVWVFPGTSFWRRAPVALSPVPHEPPAASGPRRTHSGLQRTTRYPYLSGLLGRPCSVRVIVKTQFAERQRFACKLLLSALNFRGRSCRCDAASLGFSKFSVSIRPKKMSNGSPHRTIRPRHTWMTCPAHTD